MENTTAFHYHIDIYMSFTFSKQTWKFALMFYEFKFKLFYCFNNHNTSKGSQRAHDAMLTSLSRQNDVVTSFWRNNDVIASCARWGYDTRYGITWPL